MGMPAPVDLDPAVPALFGEGFSGKLGSAEAVEDDLRSAPEPRVGAARQAAAGPSAGVAKQDFVACTEAVYTLRCSGQYLFTAGADSIAVLSSSGVAPYWSRGPGSRGCQSWRLA